MAVNPNTNFTAGQILTSDQTNRFPRGIMQQVASTTSPANVSSGTEVIQLTTPAFTAVANRYYKITYFEPQTFNASGAPSLIIARLRLTNISGTVLQTSYRSVAGLSTQDSSIFVEAIATLTAGSTVIVATINAVGGTVGISRAAAQLGQLYVEDMGPA